MWNDLGNGRCSMLDACSNPNNPEDVFKLLWTNFARHYNTNRAPIGLFYHAAWFTQPHNMEGFQRFLDTILSLDDVWFVTSWQAIQWMRNLANPVDPLNFEPFQCNNTKVFLLDSINPSKLISQILILERVFVQMMAKWLLCTYI